MARPLQYSKSVLKIVKSTPKHLTPEYMNDCANMIPKNNTPIVIKPEQEAFLRYYIQNAATRSNIYRSYALAIGEDLDKLKKEREKVPKIYNGKPVIRDGEIVMIDSKETSPYEKRRSVCAALGNRWLTYPKVNARRMQITSELLKDSVVDNEMMKIIIQDNDLNAKNTAMREYNKLAQRIVERKDVRTQSVGVIRHLYEEVDKFNIEEDE